MTGDEIRAVIDRFLSGWRRRDVAQLSACYTSDCVVVSPIFHTLHGTKQVETSYRDIFNAFDHQKIQVDEVIIDDEAQRAALVWSLTSVHRGEIFGMPGTGRSVETRIAFILNLRDGLIAKEVRVYDFTSMLMQLGVLRARAG